MNSLWFESCFYSVFQNLTCNIITGAPVETWIYVPNPSVSDSDGLQRIREIAFLQVSSRCWFQLSGTGAEKTSPGKQKTDLLANSLQWETWTIFPCVFFFFFYDSFLVCWSEWSFSGLFWMMCWLWKTHICISTLFRSDV